MFIFSRIASSSSGAIFRTNNKLFMKTYSYDGREGSHWRCGDAMDDEAMRWTMMRCDEAMDDAAMRW